MSKRPASASSSIWQTSSSVGSQVSSTVETLKAAIKIDYLEVSLQIAIVVIPLSVIAALVVLTYSQANNAMNQSLQLEDALNDGFKMSQMLNAIEEEKLQTCSYLTENHLGHDVTAVRELVTKARRATDTSVQNVLVIWEHNKFGDINAYTGKLNNARITVDGGGSGEDGAAQLDCLKLISLYQPLLNEILIHIITLFGLNEEGKTCQMLGAFQSWILAQEHMARAYESMGDAWILSYAESNPEDYARFQKVESFLMYLNGTKGSDGFEDAAFHEAFNPFVEHAKSMEERIQSDLMKYLTSKAEEEATQFYIVLCATVVVCIVCPLLALAYGYYARKQRIKLVNAARRMKEQSKLLAVEEQKTVQLLNQLLPPIVTEKIRAGEMVEPEMYDSVTVLVADIVGFTPLCSKSTPLQVVAMLNSMFMNIDRILEIHDCYKVETIGDAVVVASGVPMRNGNRHSAEIATVSLGLLMAVKHVEIAHSPGEHPLLRVGVHTGPATAGVVGSKSPKYCLLGQTVEYAGLMESHSKAMQIQLSEEACMHLTSFHTEFTVVDRGEIEVKGQGTRSTFWLKSKSSHPYVVDFAEAEHLDKTFRYNKKTDLEHLQAGNLDQIVKGGLEDVH